MKYKSIASLFITIAFVFVLFLASVPACFGAGPVVRLGYLQSDLHQLACFVALDRGLFKKEGVQVEIGGIFRAGPEEMSAFAAGSLDAGYVGVAPATVAVANGAAKVKIIAQVNLEGSAVVIRKDSPIKSVKDLKGKVVAVPGYANVQDCLLRMALKKADLSFNSVRIMILKPPEMISALESKQIDGFIAWEPYIAKAINRGMGKVLISSGEIWPNHPCCAVVVEDSFLNKFPKTVDGLLRAHVKATRFIQDYPGKAAEIGVKYTGMDLSTVKLAMKDIIYEYTPNVEGELKYVRFLKDTGAIKIANPAKFVKDIIDDAPLQKVLKTLSKN